MRQLACFFLLATIALGCGGDDGLDVPTVYEFPSRSIDGASSVSYSGQSFRHVLMHESNAYIAGLTDAIDTGLSPAPGQIDQALKFYLDFDSSTAGATPLTLSTEPPLLQSTFDDISSGKDLRSKLAGNDTATDHKDWATQFVGWDAASPTALVETWYAQLDQLAQDRAAGTIALDPAGNPIAEVYVTARGQDLKQLLQKLTLGAVAFSQGTDDYLDDDTPGKGLLSSNERTGESAYTTLEHAWDEGFGYFGSARDYNDYTDDEIAGAGGRADYSSGYHDSSGDGRIDLTAELNFGHAVNAAKRDRGSSTSAPTDLSKEIFDAFLAGRALIASVDGELSEAQLDELRGYRDTIVLGWEKAIAATIVHYINETLVDMNAFGTEGYSFLDHAKHWSELKGFALVLQFSPHSPLADADFAQLHQHLGAAPVLPNAETQAIANYKSALLAARGLVASAYGFDPANVGDDNGEGGW